MTCRQLAGACDQEFHAETFEEMTEITSGNYTKSYIVKFSLR